MSERDSASPEAEVEFDLERYREFIAQIQLRDVWLVSSKVANKHGPRNPEEAHVDFSDDFSWSNQDVGIRARARYKARFRVGSKLVASVEAEFAADYESSEPMTDDIFEVFSKNNLRLNTWPFFREFTFNTLGRMGWAPFTIPAIKINTGRG